MRRELQSQVDAKINSHINTATTSHQTHIPQENKHKPNNQLKTNNFIEQQVPKHALQ